MANSTPHIADMLRAYGRLQVPPSCPSFYQLDCLRLGTLSPIEANQLQAHLADCESCRERLAQEAAAYAAAFDAPRPVRAEATRSSEIRLIKLARVSRNGFVSSMSLLAVAAAAWLMLTPRATPNGSEATGAQRVLDSRAPSPGESSHDAAPAANVLAARLATTRRKGTDDLQLNVFCEHKGKVEQIRAGAVVSPGDRVRFQISSDKSWEVMIVGVEESGRLFSYYPLENQGSSSHHPGGQVLLAGAAEFDKSQGRESVMLVACPLPFKLDALLAGLPHECQTEGFTIYKAAQ